MIRVRLVRGPGHRDLIILGLSEGNIRKLKADEPVFIDADRDPELGFEQDVAIVYGETEAAIVQGLRDVGLEVPGVST